MPLSGLWGTGGPLAGGVGRAELGGVAAPLTARSEGGDLGLRGDSGLEALASFKELLASAVETVNDLQMNADRMTRKLATGEVKDIHSVMIAVEEANIALELTVQIRNKVVDAYQEIMRMQV